MADTTRKILVPNDQLPPVNADFNSYFLRYRIVSEDRNLSSEWSAIYEIPSNRQYVATGDGSIIYSTETKQISASWPLEDGISEYDVWYKWKPPYTPQVLVPNPNILAVSNAVLDSQTGLITYTTNTRLGYGPSHPYNVGDIVSIDQCGTSQFNLTDYVIVEVPDRTTFVIKNKNYIGQTYTFTTAGEVRKEFWEYFGRISGNVVNFYQKVGIDTRFSVRVYIPHYPINHDDDYLIFAYLDKVTV
jgi:hypothetical protein